MRTFLCNRMARTRISAADETNMANIAYTDSSTAGDQAFDLSIDPASDTETEYDVPWLEWKGYYDEIPELQASVDKKAMWTIGRGYKTDKKTDKILLDLLLVEVH